MRMIFGRAEEDVMEACVTYLRISVCIPILRWQSITPGQLFNVVLAKPA